MISREIYLQPIFFSVKLFFSKLNLFHWSSREKKINKFHHKKHCHKMPVMAVLHQIFFLFAALNEAWNLEIFQFTWTDQISFMLNLTFTCVQCFYISAESCRIASYIEPSNLVTKPLIKRRTKSESFKLIYAALFIYCFKNKNRNGTQWWQCWCTRFIEVNDLWFFNNKLPYVFHFLLFSATISAWTFFCNTILFREIRILC